jgi:uncharacterized membrane protein
MPAFDSPLFALWLLKLLGCLFLAILFLQSGADKVLDFKGNLGWMTPHFSKSPLGGMVPLLLGVITVMEVATGLLAAGGAVSLLASGTGRLGFWGAALAAFTLLALFLGQRLAKDYAGAAGLVPYFLVTLAAVFLLRE